jgi:RimJ/RimL family protein N-acetyltransferase
MAHPYWPLLDLRIRTPRLELRYPDDADVMALSALAAEGIHDPAQMPFGLPWTDAPSPELERNSVQHYWRSRAEWRPTKWDAPFTVVTNDDATIVGVQAVHTENFPTLRTFQTGSWLGRAHQGQGIGKEMRAAVLHFAFAGLHAMRATTAAFDDNRASLGVTRSLGYVENGDEITLQRDKRARQIRFKMDRTDWEPRRRDDVTIEGLEPCLQLFGIEAEPASSA